MPHRLTISDLFESLRKRLRLEWLAGRSGEKRSLLQNKEDKTNCSIAGTLNYIHPHCIQLIGTEEQEYLINQSADAREQSLQKLFALQPVAVVLVDGVEADGILLQYAEQSLTPLLCSPLSGNTVLDNLQYYASKHLSERKIIHGVFLDILGMGVLLTGHAAVGKSELALELISRGNRLVADDAPEFTRIAPDTINGTCPPLLREFLEVRGIGLLNIRAMFGENSIKDNKYLRLIINLQRMTQDEIANMDRISSPYQEIDVLGVSIPQVTIPVAPGRNLAIVSEAAARNHMLKLKGYDATEAFIARQQKAIAENT